MEHIKKITDFFEKTFPSSSAQDFDNTGIIVNSCKKNIKNVFICVDLTFPHLKELKKNKIDLVVTHHPFIFSPLKKISNKTLNFLIQNKISLLSLHTNYDISPLGMNAAFAEAFSLKKYGYLTENNEKYFKAAVYVPREYRLKILNAVAETSGIIGEYSHCSFSADGKGTFKPFNSSNPFIGIKEKLNEVDEIKLEFVLQAARMDDVIRTIKKYHPYEEPAIDIYELKNAIAKGGFGLKTAADLSFKDFTVKLKKAIAVKNLIFYGNREKIKTFGFLGGSASGIVNEIKKSGIDYLVCGEIKHSLIIELLNHIKGVFIAGHAESEYLFVNHIEKLMKKNFNIKIYKGKNIPKEIL